MLTSESAWIPDSLGRTLGRRWDISVLDDVLTVLHHDRSTCFVPPRRSISFAELLQLIESGFAANGVPRGRPLPLRWGRETDLTVSAVQALDPFLKDGKDLVYGSGFLPQPVVRLTGRRDEGGRLLDGFLTSFVNVSHVQLIKDREEFATIVDGWLSVLSRLGIHARQICLYGSLRVWQRRQVRGVTLRFRHLEQTLGDINLLWNEERPQRLAVDLGSGLERLAWVRSRGAWDDVVYGPLVRAAPVGTLDAIRTATLLLGHGIRPATSGAGGTTRRMVRAMEPASVRLGADAMVRFSHRYWSLFGSLSVEWPAIASTIESEGFHDAARSVIQSCSG